MVTVTLSEHYVASRNLESDVRPNKCAYQSVPFIFRSPEIHRIDNCAPGDSGAEPRDNLFVRRMLDVFLQSLFIGVLSRKRQIPGIGLHDRILATSQTDETRDLTRQVAQAGKCFRSVIGVGKREENNMSEHDGWNPSLAAQLGVSNPRRMTNTADREVEIVEVAPRDGLQNDPALLSTQQKVELISRCVSAGVQRIEVASFVNPKRVPQMADAEAVLEGLPASADVDASWIGLVLNARGFERAKLTQVDEINLVVMVTDTFSEKNQGMPTLAAIATVEEVVPLAQAAGIKTSVTMSASFGCPYEGEVPVGRVAEIAGRLAATGVGEIAVADTIGVAVPRDVARRMAAVKDAVDGTRLRVHVHNTRNTGYASALAAYEAGVTVLDSSLGGIGGCPFAPRATGNIATEDLVFALERSGVNTGLDLDALIAASDWLGTQLNRPTPALVSKAGPFPA